MKETFGVNIGDKVRFVCEATDGDGWSTGKILRVTGRCIDIEFEHGESYDFPKFHVRRRGIDYWFFGKNIEVLEKGKRPRNYNIR